MYQNIQKLSSIGFFDIRPGLERITDVLNNLDNPQNKIKYILIAGTNGKGSVASILSSIMVSNGYKTGLYTSPHLISVTERIKIDNKDISEEIFDSALGTVFNACENTETELSYFELVTAAAFVYFYQQNIDLGVLEVGMGGRWDATNVVNPLISVMTNISFDHTKHLGNTTELISKEKAEIIKKNVPVVCGVSGDDLKVFTDKANETNSDISYFPRDFNYKKTENNKFHYSGIDIQLGNLSTNLVGSHQIINSTLALAATELLNRKYEINIDFNNINIPLNSVELNGRFEILNGNPALILDCAHNIGSVNALVNTLDELYKHQKFVFLLSMLNDKDHKGFISTVSDKAEKIIITRIPNVRGSETEQLFK
ncbi:MAG: bifunctional folylpolyglutamate synthase/dihydrofolate synthase, partial [Thermodesulfobacteriota bacterium]